MGGERRSRISFRLEITKTHISNPSYASSRIKQRGNSLVVHWLQFSSSTEQGRSYIPDWGSNIPRPKKIKWRKHNLLHRMSVEKKKKGKEKLWEGALRDPFLPPGVHSEATHPKPSSRAQARAEKEQMLSPGG